MARRPRQECVRLDELGEGVAIGLRHGGAVVTFEVSEHGPAPLTEGGFRPAGAGWPATNVARVGSGVGVLAA